MTAFLFFPDLTKSSLSTNNQVMNEAKPTSKCARPTVTILNEERGSEHGGFCR